MEQMKNLVADIDAGTPKPMYFLMGEEPYYIDKMAQYIANTVLRDEEKGFNQLVLYGKDTSVDEIVAHAKRFPMMAEHQVIIVKEAQHLSRNIEHLQTYAEHPQPTTVLVLCYKYKKLDKRKRLYKSIQKNGALFESKKLYEYQVTKWIRSTVQGKHYQISPKVCTLLVEFLGTDLSKISNELNKLFSAVPPSSEITAELIEEYIGISKDFNNFELKKAIGENNVKKMSHILSYFAQNPKDNPFVVTVTLLTTFFTQLLQYHGLNDHSQSHVAKILGVHPYFVKEYTVAAKNYPMKKISGILSGLRQLDVKSKGVGANNIAQADLRKELLLTLL